MTRQYIGARYVPRFFENAQGGTDWVSGMIYEPLTIVTYNGNSYTSKRTVPATVGNPSANPGYWAATGLYNSQVEELRQQFENLSSEVQEDKAALQEDMAALQEDMTNLETATDKKLHAVAANRSAYKRIIVIGDSYGNRVNEENHTYFDVLRYSLGLDNTAFYHACIGGAAFASTAEGHKFIELLQGLAPSVPDHDTITDVIVQCGANDLFRPVTDTRAAMVTFINYVKTNFPNSKVTIFPCGLVFKREQMFARIATMTAFKACAGYGAAYFGSAEFILEDPHLLESDLTHPNASGVNVIARGLEYAVFGIPIETSFRYVNPTVSSITLGQHPEVTLRNIETHYIEGNRNGVVIACGNLTTSMIGFTTSEAVTLKSLEEIRVTVDNTLLCLPDGNCVTGYISLDQTTFIPAYIAVATMSDVNVLRIFPKIAAPSAANRFGIDFEFSAVNTGSISS